MVAGISGVSDRIKQMNLDNVKNKELPEGAVKHIPAEDTDKKPEDPQGRGSTMDLTV